jgi:predicted amidohydrolase
MDTEHEGILYGEVDPDRIIDQRSELPYLRDRCPEEYSVLTAPHELHP